MNLPGAAVDGELVVGHVIEGHVVVGHAGEVDGILGAEQHSSKNVILYTHVSKIHK